MAGVHRCSGYAGKEGEIGAFRSLARGLGSWLRSCFILPAVTCKRKWSFSPLKINTERA